MMNHLTVSDAEFLLANFKSPMVKVAPQGRGGHVTWGRAILHAVNPNSETATIQPLGHKRTEEVELKYLKKWHSKTEITGGLTATFAETLSKAVAIAPEVMREPARKIILTETPKPVEPVTETKKEESMETKNEKKPKASATHEDIKKRIKEVKQLIEMGKSNQEIAMILNIGYTTACRYSAKYRKQIKRSQKAVESKVSEPFYQDIAPRDVMAMKPIEQPKPQAQKSNDTELVIAVRAILKMPISVDKKLFAIEALTME